MANTIRSGERNLINNVYKNLMEIKRTEKETISLNNITKLTSELTGKQWVVIIVWLLPMGHFIVWERMERNKVKVLQTTSDATGIWNAIDNFSRKKYTET